MINTFHLKMIATLVMLVDHVAHYLLPTTHILYIPMRILGRISAPIFMYCFAMGFKHTRNRLAYQKRLALASVGMCVLNIILSMLLCSRLSVFEPNMFLTFLVLSIIIECFEIGIKTKKLSMWIVGAVLCLIATYKVEYGIFAIFTVLVFYFINHELIRNTIYVIGSLILCVIKNNFIQVFMILSVLLIAFDNKQKPRLQYKNFFYWFYPIHIALLLIIQILF